MYCLDGVAREVGQGKRLLRADLRVNGRERRKFVVQVPGTGEGFLVHSLSMTFENIKPINREDEGDVAEAVGFVLCRSDADGYMPFLAVTAI